MSFLEHMKSLTVFALALLLSQPLLAEQYYRCTAANGHIIFSQEPCGPEAEIRQHQVVPRGQSQAPNAIEQLENYRNSVRQINNITGKTEHSSDKKKTACSDVSSLKLRNARVSKDIMRCHNEDDVRHIYGAPQSVSTWSDRSAYDTRWRYRPEQGGKVYVYFKDGLVTKWSTHD